MSMSAGMNFDLRNEQAQRLSHDQSLKLSQLMRLTLDLRDPVFPNALRGIEGLERSDEILKAQGSYGVLIGGLAKEVWRRDCNPERLAAHKDTDVLILDGNYAPQNFESGIDWWLPQTERISYNVRSALQEKTQTWWTNANGIALPFSLKINYLVGNGKPGLYIPDPQTIISMNEAVALSEESEDLDLEDSVVVKLRRNLEKVVGTRVPKFISDRFKGQILSDFYSKGWFPVYCDRIGAEALAAI